MRWLSNRSGILAAIGLALGASAPAVAQHRDFPPGALILFGANWCAPCLAELRDLPALARAAAPDRVILAWTDGKPPRLWREWPDNAQIIPIADAARTMGQLGGSSAGLPYAMLLGTDGKLCADLRGKLTSERLNAMKARCRQTGANVDRTAAAAGS